MPAGSCCCCCWCTARASSQMVPRAMSPLKCTAIPVLGETATTMPLERPLVHLTSYCHNNYMTSANVDYFGSEPSFALHKASLKIIVLSVVNSTRSFAPCCCPCMHAWCAVASVQQQQQQRQQTCMWWQAAQLSLQLELRLTGHDNWARAQRHVSSAKCPTPN